MVRAEVLVALLPVRDADHLLRVDDHLLAAQRRGSDRLGGPPARLRVRDGQRGGERSRGDQVRIRLRVAAPGRAGQRHHLVARERVRGVPLQPDQRRRGRYRGHARPETLTGPHRCDAV